ncbi:hypothetical protein BH23BAC1_BH23BAC1_18630 [soil metagenome]
MKKIILIIGFISLGILHSTHVFSQFSASEARSNYQNSKANDKGLDRHERYTSIGGSLNALNYFGDLAPFEGNFSTDLSLTRPGLGFVISRRFTPRISVRGTYTFGRLRGDDISADPIAERSRDRFRRNLHFRNDIHEVAVTGVVDLLANRDDYTQRRWLTPYAFLGIGIFHHNPRAKVPVNMGDEWVNLRDFRTEGVSYSRIQFVVPYGLGARLKLTERLDLALELGIRQLFFDYIDDASNVYVDPGTLGSDLARIMAARSLEPIAAATGEQRLPEFIQNANNRIIQYQSSDGNTYPVFEGNSPGNRRGNPNDYDIYLVTSLQLTYIIMPRAGRAKYRN